MKNPDKKQLNKIQVEAVKAAIIKSMTDAQVATNQLPTTDFTKATESISNGIIKEVQKNLK